MAIKQNVRCDKTGVVFDASQKRIFVKDIKKLTNAQIEVLECGDYVVKKTGLQKHTYRVSYKEEKQGLCLTYTDASTSETVSYDYVDGVWTYNSTDITNLGSGGGGGSSVVANPTLDGTEPNLTGLEVDGSKYKVPQGSSGGGNVPAYFVSAQALKEFANTNINRVGYEVTINISKLKTLLLSKGFITANQTIGETGFKIYFHLVYPTVTVNNSAYGGGTEISSFYIEITQASDVGIYSVNVVYNDIMNGSENIYAGEITLSSWGAKVVDLLDAIQSDENYKFVINSKIFIQYAYCYEFAPIFFSMGFVKDEYGAGATPITTTEFLSMLDTTETQQ